MILDSGLLFLGHPVCIVRNSICKFDLVAAESALHAIRTGIHRLPDEVGCRVGNVLVRIKTEFLRNF